MRAGSFALAAAISLFSTGVLAGSAADAVTVSDAHVRAVPPGQPNSASFMTLSNNSDTNHAVVGAASSVSKVAELHTHTMTDGMMRMRRIDQIDLPANGSVTLQPGGLHVMMIGLERELVPGEEVAITLMFEDGSNTRFDAPVRKLQMKMMQHDETMKMDDQGTMQHDKGMK